MKKNKLKKKYDKIGNKFIYSVEKRIFQLKL